MNNNGAKLALAGSEAKLLEGLVAAELDRRCAGIDEIIQQVYQVVPAKHTEQAISEIKVAVLELVRSPLADLERKLAAMEVEPGEEPEPEPEVKPGAEVKAEPDPATEPAKSKA